MKADFYSDDEWENIPRDEKIALIQRKIQHLQNVLDAINNEIEVHFYYQCNREVIYVSPETSPIEIITDHGIKIIPGWTIFHLNCKFLKNEELFLPINSLTDDTTVILSGTMKCANAR